MLKTLYRIKKILVGIAAMLVLGFFPTAGVTFAEETCTPPSPTQPGVHWPTGSDASTFTYQCDGPYAGKWINDHYIYNPATQQRTARDDPNYTYDCAASKWYMTKWEYSPAKGTYRPVVVTTTAPADATTNCPVPDNPNTPATNNAAPTTSTNSNTTNGNTVNTTNVTGNSNTNINDTTGASMNNGILSFADTGNAVVSGNTSGGNATTGDATVIANVINMLQSSSNVLGDPNVLTFTANINGDVNGDLLLDPAKLGSVQPANTTTSLDNNVAVNNSTDASINNDISLGANSGDATVARNTSAGNATSGNAKAVANIVNTLNSAVTAGKSFIGVININGNLNGDILLPPNFIDTLLASNVPRYTVNTAALTNNVNITNNNNQSINNAVTANASSGNASVAGNTSAGSATTGNALTNLTVFNLTGSNVVASNDLLVFVNVLGKWYGMILNAPAGTTAASLGGGVTSVSAITNDASLTNTNNQSINNNINVDAQSGDAKVADNTKAGNAKSGDASASVNLMNMINDSLSLNGWFGLLFINVFGTWNGSFGVNTSAGDPAATKPAPSGPTTPMFRFVPTSGDSGGQSFRTFSDTGAGTSASTPTAVLAAQTVRNPATTSGNKLPSIDSVHHNNFLIPALGAGLALLILLASERDRFLKRH